jgi:hypothetical protein
VFAAVEMLLDWSRIFDLHFGCCRFDCFEDFHVSGASADDSACGPSDVLISWVRISIKQFLAGENHGWDAVTTLGRIPLHKGALQRMEVFWGPYAFDRHNLLVSRLYSENQA